MRLIWPRGTRRRAVAIPVTSLCRKSHVSQRRRDMGHPQFHLLRWAESLWMIGVSSGRRLLGDDDSKQQVPRLRE